MFKALLESSIETIVVNVSFAVSSMKPKCCRYFTALKVLFSISLAHSRFTTLQPFKSSCSLIMNRFIPSSSMNVVPSWMYVTHHLIGDL